MNKIADKWLKNAADYYGQHTKFTELGNAAYDLYIACTNPYTAKPLSDNTAKMLNRLRRAGYDFSISPYRHIIANITEVEVLIAQIKYLLDVDPNTIEFLKSTKIYVEHMKIREQEANLNGKDNKQTAQRNS